MRLQICNNLKDKICRGCIVYYTKLSIITLIVFIDLPFSSSSFFLIICVYVLLFVGDLNVWLLLLSVDVVGVDVAVL